MQDKKILLKAMWDYNAQDGTEMSFKKGDVMELVEKANEDWWFGKLGSAKGLFPANRVQIMPEDDGPAIPVKPPMNKLNKPGSNVPTVAEPDKPVIKTPKPTLKTEQTSDPSPPRKSPLLEENNKFMKELENVAASRKATVSEGSKPTKTSIESAAPSRKSTISDGARPSDKQPANVAPKPSMNNARSSMYESSLKNAGDFAKQTTGDGESQRGTSAATSRRLSVDSDQSTASSVKRLSPLLIAQLEQNVADVASAGTSFDPANIDKRGRSRAPSSLKRDESPIEDVVGGFTPPKALNNELALRLGKVAPQKDEDSDSANEDSDVSLEPANVNDIKKDGMLGRRNDDSMLSMRAWKNVWCELAGGSLYFYKDPQNKKKIDKRERPIAIMDIRSSRIDNSGQYDKKKQIFALVTMKGELHHFQAPSEADMNAWCNIILEQSGVRKENLLSEEVNIPPPATKKNSDPPKKLSKKNTTGDKKKPSVENDDNLTEEERRERAKSKLFGFFKNRPSPETIKDRGLIPQDMLFGGILELQLQKEKRKIPSIVEQCIKKVEEKDLKSVGIYRLSGNASHIQKLRLIYNQDPSLVDFSQEEWNDINVITGTLKLYFRELQAPLLTFERYDTFIAAAKTEDMSARNAAIKDVLTKLPKANLDTLQYVIRHLEKVAKYSDENKMDAGNLAVVFGPTLLRPQVEGLETILNVGLQNNVVELMILNPTYFFGK